MHKQISSIENVENSKIHKEADFGSKFVIKGAGNLEVEKITVS